jgi:glutamate racemase
MPWGPRTPQDVAARALECARAAAGRGLDALVVACNTASVHALSALRDEFEPLLPVIGTVPAIKPAASAHATVAIWATPATTGSAYQRGLIAEFGNGARVTEVPCPGLADAVETGDARAVAAAVAAAAARTPAGTEAVVLGCTHYELVAARIGEALPGALLYGSADAVAAQVLRRVARPEQPGQGGQGHNGGPGTALRNGRLEVLQGGRPAELPAVARMYLQGALPAQTPATA